MKRESTDLLPGVEDKNIILVQPQMTVGRSKEWVRTNLRIEVGVRSNRWLIYDYIYQDVVELNGLTHVGCIAYSYGKVYYLEPCGGQLHFGPIPQDSSFDWLRKFHPAYLTCSNPDCKMKIIPTTHVEREKPIYLFLLQNALRHLMLKQIRPHLPTGNFIYCGDNDEEAIRNLGTISLARGYLWGSLSTPKNPSLITQCHSLAFMLMPGMDTRCDYDGFDEWATSLDLKMAEYTQTTLDLMQSLLRGPKPMSR